MRAFVFPGQGSQIIGMGKELADAFAPARAVFEEVDDALRQSLSKIMWQGPEDELVLTENAQPALMAVSMAVVRVMQAHGIELDAHAHYVAGHSLGEYTALAAIGTLSLTDTARLLKLRGQAMQRAVPVGDGAMAAILGPSFDEVADIAATAAKDDICSAANDNATGQVVISGHSAAVDRAITLAQERGARRAIKLAVSAPFHCALMQPAAEEMAAALRDTDLNALSLPLIANVSAHAVTDIDMIRDLLVQQVTGTVRWRESMIWAAEQGVTELVEIGTGKVLTGMARRIDKRLSAQAVNVPEDIDTFIESLK